MMSLFWRLFFYILENPYLFGVISFFWLWIGVLTPKKIHWFDNYTISCLLYWFCHKIKHKWHSPKYRSAVDIFGCLVVEFDRLSFIAKEYYKKTAHFWKKFHCIEYHTCVIIIGRIAFMLYLIIITYFTTFSFSTSSTNIFDFFLLSGYN